MLLACFISFNPEISPPPFFSFEIYLWRNQVHDLLELLNFSYARESPADCVKMQHLVLQV